MFYDGHERTKIWFVLSQYSVTPKTKPIDQKVLCKKISFEIFFIEKYGGSK